MCVCVCVCMCVRTHMGEGGALCEGIISVTAILNVTLHMLVAGTSFSQTVENSHSDYQFCEIVNCYDSATFLKQ